MENLDFGPGFGVFILVVAFLGLLLKTGVVFLLLHFLSRALTPTTARLLRLEHALTGTSRFDVAAYAAAWLLLTPLITGPIEIYVQSHFDHLGSFGYLNYYLFGLTTWYYDPHLETFQQKKGIRIFLQAITFVLLAIVLNLLQLFIHDNGYLYLAFSWSILHPTAFVLLTLFFLRRNRRETPTEPEQTIPA